jgi:hypothetical protein
MEFHFQARSQKLRKANLSFVMPVRLSVRMEQLGSQCPNFHEVTFLSIFRKYVNKIQIPLKSDKSNGYFA